MKLQYLTEGSVSTRFATLFAFTEATVGQELRDYYDALADKMGGLSTLLSYLNGERPVKGEYLTPDRDQVDLVKKLKDVVQIVADNLRNASDSKLSTKFKLNGDLLNKAAARSDEAGLPQTVSKYMKQFGGGLMAAADIMDTGVGAGTAIRRSFDGSSDT